MSYDTHDFANDVGAHLAGAGYTFYYGDPDSGTLMDVNLHVPGVQSDYAWWFTWTDGKCDVEVGESCNTELGAMSDALSHFFSNATICKETQE